VSPFVLRCPSGVSGERLLDCTRDGGLENPLPHEKGGLV
jgi:hypothetical protein